VSNSREDKRAKEVSICCELDVLQWSFAFFMLSMPLILYCPATFTSQTFRIIKVTGLAKQLIAHDAQMHNVNRTHMLVN